MPKLPRIPIPAGFVKKLRSSTVSAVGAVSRGARVAGSGTMSFLKRGFSGVAERLQKKPSSAEAASSLSDTQVPPLSGRHDPEREPELVFPLNPNIKPRAPAASPPGARPPEERPMEQLPVQAAPAPTLASVPAPDSDPDTADIYGADFLAQEEATATDAIYHDVLPVDLSSLGPGSSHSDWEVQIRGEILGSFSRQEIIDGIREGAFPQDIQIRQDPASPWQSAMTLVVDEETPPRKVA